MDYTSEELRLEEKRNIEIIESCQSAIDEIDEHLDNIDDLIDKIVNQGDILAQIAAVDEKMEAIDKVHAFLSKDDENTKNKLLEEKKRLSETDDAGCQSATHRDAHDEPNTNKRFSQELW